MFVHFIICRNTRHTTVQRKITPTKSSRISINLKWIKVGSMDCSWTYQSTVSVLSIVKNQWLKCWTNELYRMCCCCFFVEFWGRNWSSSLDQILEQYGAYEVIDFVVQHLSRHPFLAFGMSMCVLSCALPFIIFMVFAIATVIMTFTGFVIIEGKWLLNCVRTTFWVALSFDIQHTPFFVLPLGTLITLASALLFGFLGAVILFFLFFTFVMMAGYFGLVQIYELVDYPNRRRALIQYLRGTNGTKAKVTTTTTPAVDATAAKNRNTTTVNGNE